jgi:hypothetical protein
MQKTVKKERSKLPKRIEAELATSSIVVPEGRYTSCKHLANIGDIIALMPAIKKYWTITGRKVKLCQVLDFPGSYYAGARHPTKSHDGTQVTVNQKMFDMIKPLVESQEYIHSFEAYNGQPIDIDFDVIRGRTFVGMPNLMLQCWVSFAYPDLACDLSKTWIDLPEVKKHPVLKQVKGKVIVNFTERYRSEPLDYMFLKNYAPDLIFAGTRDEHFAFCNKWQVNIPLLEVKDFLEYAYAVKYCRFFMGVQSFGWNVAQSIHAPRMVELCRFAPNVQPNIGEDSYGYFHQAGAEYYFRVLYNKTVNK